MANYLDLNGTTDVVGRLKGSINEKASNDDVQLIVDELALKADKTEVEAVKERVDEIEAYKFPNVTIFGTPQISNGQMSGFSNVNYAQFPFLVDFKGQRFEINMCFTTGENVTEQQNIIDSQFGLAMAVRNGKFVIAMSSNGTSWDMGEHVGMVSVSPMATYYVKLTWDGSAYDLLYSVDKETYSTDIHYVDSKTLFPRRIVIGKGVDDTHIFGGSINLNYCSLSIVGHEVWTGMDDVGLATRLATDLSNIDDAGVEKVNEIVRSGGYITQETDPTVPAHVKAITEADIAKWNEGGGGGGGESANYLYNKSVSDLNGMNGTIVDMKTDRKYLAVETYYNVGTKIYFNWLYTQPKLYSDNNQLVFSEYLYLNWERRDIEYFEIRHRIGNNQFNYVSVYFCDWNGVIKPTSYLQGFELYINDVKKPFGDGTEFMLYEGQTDASREKNYIKIVDHSAQFYGISNTFAAYTKEETTSNGLHQIVDGKEHILITNYNAKTVMGQPIYGGGDIKEQDPTVPQYVKNIEKGVVDSYKVMGVPEGNYGMSLNLKDEVRTEVSESDLNIHFPGGCYLYIESQMMGDFDFQLYTPSNVMVMFNPWEAVEGAVYYNENFEEVSVSSGNVKYIKLPTSVEYYTNKTPLRDVKAYITHNDNVGAFIYDGSDTPKRILTDDAMSAYTPTSGFATINGQKITQGGNIVIQGGGGGGGDPHVVISQADYDALEVKDPNTYYFIDDAESPYYTKAEIDVILGDVNNLLNEIVG